MLLDSCKRQYKSIISYLYLPTQVYGRAIVAQSLFSDPHSSTCWFDPSYLVGLMNRFADVKCLNPMHQYAVSQSGSNLAVC